MLYFRKRKNRSGFILIYVVFIVTLCIFIALNCFSLEMLKRENNLKMEKNILKVEVTQKIKEYLFTDLDEFLYKNKADITNEGIKDYLKSTTDSSIQYEDSYIEYNKEKNYFLVVYYVNNKFYKEEFYEYRVKDKLIFYTCIDYSFKKGELK